MNQVILILFIRNVQVTNSNWKQGVSLLMCMVWLHSGGGAKMGITGRASQQI